MGTPGSNPSNDVERFELVENGTEGKKFPFVGDPFKDLDEEAKKLFRACRDLTFPTFEGLEEKAKKLLATCQYLNLQTSEGLDEKAKKLLEACQDPNHNSIKDLREETLTKVDKNGMNIFHVLLFDEENQQGTDHEWYTKTLDTATRQKIVTFIEAISQKFPKQVIEKLMIQPDNFNRTPLHYAGIIDEGNENEDSNITLAYLKHGADKALFEEDENKESPVNFIATSNLKVHLDSKQRNQGPVGHKNRVAHCDISILQPKVKVEEHQTPNTKPQTRNPKIPLNLEYLEKLATKHRDLFDHQVVSAMIW